MVAAALPHESLIYPLGGKRKLTAEKVCRLCGSEWTAWRVRTRHHVVPQSWFLGLEADDVRRGIAHAQSNLVPLCRPCHDEVDSRYPVVREMARRMLRLVMTQQEVAFVIALRGREWLDLEYPLDITLRVV